MATSMTEMVAERPLADEIFSVKNGKENGTTVPPYDAESGQKLALAPLVDKIAYGIARGLVVAMKELENHIASETRKVGDNVGRRLDTFQASLQNLTEAAAEQRSFNTSIQEKCQVLAEGVESLKEADLRLATSVTEQIAAATAPLQHADAHQQAELASLRTATAEISAAISERIDALCRELHVQQEDIGAIKSTLSGFSATVEGLAARLDRQADALRTMSAAYAQRETELESLVEGLARLRAYPAPAPVDRL